MSKLNKLESKWLAACKAVDVARAAAEITADAACKAADIARAAREATAKRGAAYFTFDAAIDANKAAIYTKNAAEATYAAYVDTVDASEAVRDEYKKELENDKT